MMDPDEARLALRVESINRFYTLLYFHPVNVDGIEMLCGGSKTRCCSAKTREILSDSTVPLPLDC
jgi:hypothetical protein